MLKKVIGLLLVISLTVSLCGCEFLTYDTAELLTPPRLTGDLATISDAIKKSVKGSYTFQYPAGGDYRSAVIQKDIDSDGNTEVFAFYSTTEKETLIMSINAVVNRKDEWVSIAEQRIAAGGVDRVDFCDLDGDGTEEILVGWQIYGTSEMQLAVYSMEENTLIQRMLQKYTHFLVCDLDENDSFEVLVIRGATSEEKATAELFVLTEKGITQLAGCGLDSSAKTINQPIVGTLSTGRRAVYIDEIKGVGAVTEVLYMEKGNLLNPLLSAETGENTSTLRSVSLSVQDINKDEILEIPVQTIVPSVIKSDVKEKLYLTEWCTFNGEILVNQLTTMINLEDGYYYTVPAKIKNSIAVLKDTENRIREIYKYNPEDMTVSDRLIYFKTAELKKWDDDDKPVDMIELARDEKNIYLCSVTPAAEAEGITIESIKAAFVLMNK